MGPGFISISPAKMMRMSKFVPFDGLKLRNPSELLHLPSFLVHAKLMGVIKDHCVESYFFLFSSFNFERAYITASIQALG